MSHPLDATHLALVKRAAKSLVHRWGPGAIDDMVGDGAVGLLAAAQRFDARRAVPFGAYAWPVVRGAAFDGQRTELRHSQRRETLSTDDASDTGQVVDSIVSPQPSPEEHSAVRDELRKRLAILPAEDIDIIVRHYLGGERFDHIALSLGISKSWLSRRHSRALRMMRDGERPPPPKTKPFVQKARPRPKRLRPPRPGPVPIGPRDLERLTERVRRIFGSRGRVSLGELEAELGIETRHLEAALAAIGGAKWRAV